MSKKSYLYHYSKPSESRLLRLINEASKALPPLEPKGYAQKTRASDGHGRVLTVLLSDLHIGTDLLSSQHLRRFGTTEEARRLAYILRNVLEYKTDKRDDTVLHIDLNGDLIAGMLGHDDKMAAPLTNQIFRAEHLLSQFVWHCATHFKRVAIHWQAGNHGRNLLRHKTGRADNEKYENFELIIAMAIRNRCRGLKNVTWSITRRPWSDIPFFGWHKLMTHGDTVMGAKPGTKGFRGLVAEINASPYYRQGGYDVIELGHWHDPEAFMTGRTRVFVNGAMIPPDGHSESQGYLNLCAQWLYEATERFPVGDMRRLELPFDVDSDDSFDALISPWDLSLVFTDTDDAA